MLGSEADKKASDARIAANEKRTKEAFVKWLSDPAIAMVTRIVAEKGSQDDLNHLLESAYVAGSNTGAATAVLSLIELISNKEKTSADLRPTGPGQVGH